MSRPPITDADVEALKFARALCIQFRELAFTLKREHSLAGRAIRTIDAITTHHSNTLSRKARRKASK